MIQYICSRFRYIDMEINIYLQLIISFMHSVLIISNKIIYSVDDWIIFVEIVDKNEVNSY